jgi:hypothetical protein
MKLFSFFILTASFAAMAQEESPGPCWLKNYNYVGPYYSDSYAYPVRNGVESCHERKTIDAPKLGEQHKVTRGLIDDQIEKMLNDPSCKDVHETLNDFRGKRKKQKSRIENKFRLVTLHFEKIKHLIDIQRQYAYGAAYNSTCSTERNSESSFIDLDAINKILIPSEGSEVKIQKNNEKVQNCANVSANGDTDLDGFVISMKKAKGKDFQLMFDPYGIPDQIILTSSNGAVLYDSGCTDSNGQKDLSVKVPMPQGDIRDVNVKVVNNCADKSKTQNVSSWEMSIKCEQEEAQLCAVQRNDLVELIKQELELYKRFMDANTTERHCFIHFDEDILAGMESVGLPTGEGGTHTNGMCETLDEECEARQRENAQKEVQERPQITSGPVPLNEDAGPTVCTERPKISESILKLISWNYCEVARKKLGLE